MVEGFDGSGKVFWCLVVGVVEEGFEGVVDEGGVEEVVFGFVGELGFPVLAGGFVNNEGAFEVGGFFVEFPVADASTRDAGDLLELFVGVVG